jgi:hypothetical protein
MKIYVLEGIHFTVPGHARTMFATREAADKEAAALTNDLREWVELPKDATATNWQEKLREARLKRAEDMSIEIDDELLNEDPSSDALGDALGDENGDVWITEEELVGAGRFVPERTDAEIVRETNDLAHICLIHMGFNVPDGHKFFDSDNPRSKQAWQHACEIMEHMTATDPYDALANLDGVVPDAPATAVAPDMLNAAPDMLAALKLVEAAPLKVLTHFDRATLPDGRSQLSVIRAAIAKADGREAAEEKRRS